MINNIFKNLLQLTIEVLLIALIFLPIIPVILYIENGAIKNILYLILIPTSVLISSILWKRINKTKIFKENESDIKSNLE